MYLVYVCLLLFSLLVICNGQCPYNATSLAISNGYISDPSNIRIDSSNNAYGYIDYSCNTGYALNPTIGGRLTCSATGIWSTIPVCLTTGRCPTAPLFAFIQNSSVASTIIFSGNYSLPTDGNNNTNVISGAFLPLTCNSGYVNVGGPLNITCVAGSWTTLPNCVSNTGSGSITTTTVSTSTGSRCPYNSTSWTITNGFPSNASALLMDPTTSTATGWVMFACSYGYVIDPTVGALYTCNNGVWSTKPQCLKTGRCLLANLTTFLSTAFGLQNVGQQLTQGVGETTLVINSSYSAYTCISGYINIGGNLNITCNADGTWSQFPNCVSSTQTTTTLMPAVTSCPFSSNVSTIANGYISNWGGLILLNSTQASSRSYIDYACISPYTLSGNARITCTNTVWSTQPVCVGVTTATTTTPMPAVTSCPFPSNVTTIANGYISNWAGLILSNATQASAGSYIDYACISPYTLSGNARITCTNGVWSTQPVCVGVTTTTPTPAVTSCPFPSNVTTIANGYLSNWAGLILSNATQASSGSYIDYACISPYTLSGNARITCTNGVWSAQPVCVGQAGATTTTTTTTATTKTTTVLSSLSCVGLPSVTNGYLSNTSSPFTQIGTNNYQGQLYFTCNPGYTHLNTSGRRWVNCTNGVWDPLPVCIASPTCSFATLQSSLVNVAIVSSSLHVGTGNGILAGGWIQLQCASGFTLSPFSSSLNVTCQSTGAWTQFPVCSH